MLESRQQWVDRDHYASNPMLNPWQLYKLDPQGQYLKHDPAHLDHEDGHSPVRPVPAQGCPTYAFEWRRMQPFWRKGCFLISIEHDGRKFISNKPVRPGDIVEFHDSLRLQCWRAVKQNLVSIE